MPISVKQAIIQTLSKHGELMAKEIAAITRINLASCRSGIRRLTAEEKVEPAEGFKWRAKQ